MNKTTVMGFRSLSTNSEVRFAVKAAAEAQRILPAGRMRAWRVHAYGPLTELKLEEARVPPLRAQDELLVRVHSASINPLDVNMIGGYGSQVLNVLRALKGSEGVEFPLVPGRDFVGTVERVGSSSQLKPGDRVWGVVPPHIQGSHAEFVVVRDSWVGPAPSTLDDAQAGAALYAALSASSAIRIAGVDPRSRVLLLGLGGVGQAALQLLVNKGVQVVVGCTGELCESALRLGASAALDRHAPDYNKLIADSGPYDVVLDCAGIGGTGAGSLGAQCRRYVTLTTPLLADTDRLGLALGAATSLATLIAQSVSAMRVQATTTPAPQCPRVRWAYFMPSAADIRMLHKLAEQNKFTVDVERVYPWWEGAEAYERAAHGHARGKLVLDFNVQPH